MNYALIENGIVINIICLHPGNVADFPNAILMGDIPAGIGDEYIDGVFYRNGERILTDVEYLNKLCIEKDATIAELDAALLEATYTNLIGGDNLAYN